MLWSIVPLGRWAANKEAYVNAGVKYIFQGGEKHDMAGMSYTSSANHEANMNAAGTRVVSCNTTGLSRTLVPLYEHCGSLKVECTMIRRAADPGDSKKGPINAIKPVLKVPSHHGPDVMTVKPEIDINSMAVAVPTTLMHCHSIVAFLPEGHGLTTESVLQMWRNNPRIIIMNGGETNITTTAEVMEYARDIGRKWGDLHEIFVWEDGVARRKHALLLPGNSPGIRCDSRKCRCDSALMGTEKDWRASLQKPMRPFLPTTVCESQQGLSNTAKRFLQKRFASPRFMLSRASLMLVLFLMVSAPLSTAVNATMEAPLQPTWEPTAALDERTEAERLELAASHWNAMPEASLVSTSLTPSSGTIHLAAGSFDPSWVKAPNLTWTSSAPTTWPHRNGHCANAPTRRYIV